MFCWPRAAMFTATAIAVTLSQLGGKRPGRRPASVRAGSPRPYRRITLAPTKVFDAASQRDRRMRVGSSPGASSRRSRHRRASRRIRKRSTAHPLGYPRDRARRRLDVAGEFQPFVQQLELDGCVKLSARDQRRPLRRQAAVRRTKASLLSVRTAASAQAEAPLAPSKETYVQCSRPSPSSATTPSLCSLCSSRWAAPHTQRSAWIHRVAAWVHADRSDSVGW